MDEVTRETGDDDFSRLLAQLGAPTTEAVTAPPPRPNASSAAPRVPELMGADELASAPYRFPPVPMHAPELVVPPLVVPPLVVPPLVVAPIVSAPPIVSASPSAASPMGTAPPVAADPFASLPVAADPFSSPAADFAALLSPAAALPKSAPSVSTSHFGTGMTAHGPAANSVDETDISRSTAGEKIILILAVLLPPLGFLAAAVASIASRRRRGWVIGVLKAALATSVVLSIVVGIAGSIGYEMLRQQQAHDRTAAASAGFCATIVATPSMVQLPDFGWPAVAASIPDSLAAMQAYEDRWTKLAKLSPDGIRPEVVKIATAAQKIIDGVTVARTVDDASNIAAMSAAAKASGVPAWYAEYCPGP